MNLLFTVIGGKFKFQVQDSFLEYFYFGDLKKNIPLSEKKPTLALVQKLLKFGGEKNETHFLKKATFSTAIVKS